PWRNGTESHVVQAAVARRIAENPLLRSAVGNAQIQATAVGIHAWLTLAFYELIRQSIECPLRHCQCSAPNFAHSQDSDTKRRWRTRQDSDSKKVPILSRDSKT